MSFVTEEKVWYKRNKEAEPERAKFILQKGQNTTVLEIKRGGERQQILAHADQFRARFEAEDVEIPEEEHEETEEEIKETEQNMVESGNDITDLEDKDKTRSPLKRTEEERMQGWRRPSGVVRRSDRPDKSVKPRRFRVWVAWYANETPEKIEQTLGTKYREITRLDTRFPRHNSIFIKNVLKDGYV